MCTSTAFVRTTYVSLSGVPDRSMSLSRGDLLTQSQRRPPHEPHERQPESAAPRHARPRHAAGLPELNYWKSKSDSRETVGDRTALYIRKSQWLPSRSESLSRPRPGGRGGMQRGDTGAGLLWWDLPQLLCWPTAGSSHSAPCADRLYATKALVWKHLCGSTSDFVPLKLVSTALKACKS